MNLSSWILFLPTVGEVATILNLNGLVFFSIFFCLPILYIESVKNITVRTTALACPDVAEVNHPTNSNNNVKFSIAVAKPKFNVGSHFKMSFALMNICISSLFYFSRMPFWYLILWIVLVSLKGSILFFVDEKTGS